MPRERSGGKGLLPILIAIVALGWLLSDDEDGEPRPAAVQPAAGPHIGEPATGISENPTPRVTPIARPRVTPIARPGEFQEVREPTRPTVSVTGDVVNLRAGPSTDDRVVAQARRGDKAEELGRSGGWVRLRLEKGGAEGWMFGRYVGRDPPVAGSVVRRSQEPSLAPAGPTALRSPTPTEVSDDAIRRIIIEQSIAQYPGSCPCPYNVDRGGRRCGGRSAYSRPGGASPFCYPSDVSASALTAYRQALAAR